MRPPTNRAPRGAAAMTALVRVRCGRALHRIALSRRGQLALLDHPDRAADRALAALGGEARRCLRVLEAWRRAAYLDLPPELRRLRRAGAAAGAERRRREAADPLSMPLRERAARRARRLAREALRTCDYRWLASSWGDDDAIPVTIPDDRHRRSVPLTARWLRVWRRGLATAMDPDGRRVFVLDLVSDDPAVVVAVRWSPDGRLFPCRARVVDGALRWEDAGHDDTA